MSRLEGRYRAVVQSIQYGTAETGTDQLALEMKITENGQHVTAFLPFTDASASYSISKLKATGWPGGDLESLANDDDSPKYTPVECDVTVAYDTYDGKERMKVDIGFGGKIQMRTPMDHNAKKMFGAKFNALVGAPISNSGTEFPPKDEKPKKGGLKL